MWKKLVCLLSVVAILLGAMGLAGCVNEEKRATEHIENVTGIGIPGDAEVLFHYSETIFQGGRSHTATVFKFEIEPTEWLQENEFSAENNSQFESVVENSFDWFETIEMPKAYFPDFEKPYLWLRVPYVDFVYQPETLTLIVREKGLP